MLKTGQFPFLTTVMETLRRHAQTKPIEALRQKTLSIMRSLINKETISNAMAPFILKETVEHCNNVVSHLNQRPRVGQWFGCSCNTAY